MKKDEGVIGLLVGIVGFFFLLILSAHGAESGSPWRDEWEKTLAAARNEGRLTVYLEADENLREFRKEYPEIKTVSALGKGSVLWPRIAAERRAGKYLADVMVSGAFPPYPDMYKAGILDPIRPALILPEVTDESKWYEGKHRYVDPESKYIFAHMGVPSEGIQYNTTLVNPSGFKSYWDFIDPRWKGKIVAFDPMAGRAQMRFLYNNPELGPKFLKLLFREMGVIISRDRRQSTDWLSMGKFAICFFCQGVEDARTQGLPVDIFSVHWKEGLVLTTGGNGVTSLVNRAPHPNAAKLFINWFLSRKGQIAFQRAYPSASAPNSRRIDIPKDYLPISNRRVEGVNYFFDSAELIESIPLIRKFVEEVLR